MICFYTLLKCVYAVGDEVGMVAVNWFGGEDVGWSGG